MSDIIYSYTDTTQSHATAINSVSVSHVSGRFLEILDGSELVQHNALPTCNNKPLDLAITNGLSVDVNIAEKACTSIHCPLEISVDLPGKTTSEVVTRRTYNYKKVDFDVVHHLFACICWNALFDFSSVNDALSNFYDIVFAVIDDCVPKVTIKPRKFPHWYGRTLINAINDKEKYHNIFIKSGRTNNEAYRNFSRLRCEVKRLQRSQYNHFVENVGKNIKSNPKNFWSFVKSQKSSNSLPKVMTYNGEDHSTIKNILHAFSKYFESVFLVDDGCPLPYCKTIDVPQFKLPHVTAEQMKKEILDLDQYSCCGYDNFSALFLIKCAEPLSLPLATIFNMSIDQSEFPSLLKRNNVVPIFKRKGEKTCVESYRAISIQPLVCKLFERIVNRELRKHLDGLICDEQHGFSPKKSTVSNLLLHNERITQALDDGEQMHTIYTDFEKAFDKVSHRHLLLKMRCQFGIVGGDLDWFQSYLSDRHQRVVLYGVESDWVSVKSGVPQGSILGPSLFIMYINDLPSQLESSKVLMFADDAKISKVISSIVDCISLQFDLNSFFSWCDKWKLSLNLDKCYYMNFSLKKSRNITYTYGFNDVTIKYVNLIKDLGVHYTSNMNFELHITKIVKKSFRMLGFVKRIMKPFSDTKVLLTLYNSYIRSRLDYCSPVWSPSSQYLIDKVERVQRKFLKHLAFQNRLRYDDYTYLELCKHFKLSTLEARRSISDITYFNKLITNNVNSPPLTSSVYLSVPTIRRNTCSLSLRSGQSRSTSLFCTLKKSRLKIRKTSYFPRTTAIANSLPDDVDVFDTNITMFKRSVAVYFI